MAQPKPCDWGWSQLGYRRATPAPASGAQACLWPVFQLGLTRDHLAEIQNRFMFFILFLTIFLIYKNLLAVLAKKSCCFAPAAESGGTGTTARRTPHMASVQRQLRQIFDELMPYAI